MLTVAVTGASGFIGNCLVLRLHTNGGCDVLPISRSGNENMIIKVDDYRNALPADVLVHLAENSNRHSVNSAGEACVDEATKVLDSLLAKKYSKFIYCSSAVVYGDMGDRPYTECSPAKPVDSYTKLKLTNEQKVLNAGGIVVRFTNIIGMGMSKNNVLSDILSQLDSHGSVTIRDGSPVRDFMWQEDAASALELLVFDGEPGIYNVGTGIGTSIECLAEMVLDISADTRCVKSEAINQSSSYNVVDIGKMKNLYRWSPSFTLNQSLRLMMA